MDSDFGYCTSGRTPERRSSSEHFVVEDLLDFSNDDGVVQDDPVDIFEEGNNGIQNSNSNSDDSNSDVVTPPGSVNSFSGNNNDQSVFPVATGDIVSSGFSEELCVPYDDLAELEWLSNFVEESFSSEDLQKSHLSALSSAIKTRPELTGSSETRYYNTDTSRPDTDISPNPVFSPEMPVPGKARSKRSRAAPCNWTSRLKVLSKGSPDLDRPVQVRTGDELLAKPTKPSSKKKNGSGLIPRLGTGSGSRSTDTPDGEVRRCLHCSTDKTPQWRTGPLGPKTLCNACGVRYKSGRLVPEYRPASSPSFVMTKHSNSHRKVMELRRQKELQKQHQYIQHQHYQQQLVIHSNNNHPNNMIFDPTNTDDYLIHQHIGPDYRQLT